MRIFISIFTILLICNETQGQNLTLDQVISLRTKSLAGIEEFLTSKNWQLTEATEPGDQTRGTATFAFNKSTYDDKATSFIIYFYGKYSITPNRIGIQFHKTATYNTYMSRLKALGYKLISSKVVDGNIEKIYKSKTLTIQVSTGTLKDDFATNTIYNFFICTSVDYSLTFEEED